MATSKLAGGPLVERSAGAVRVSQSRAIGWGLLAFGLLPPSLVLASDWGRLARDPAGYAARTLGSMGWGAAAALSLAALLFGGLTLYGLAWLLWTRELDVRGGRWRFTSGFGPRPAAHEGAAGDVKTLHLWRKRMRSAGTAGTSDIGRESGRLLESWELRLALPGAPEPLFLGEWGDKAEAAAEAALWKELFPNLAVDEGETDA